jgi:diaminopimelate decarboxylase
MVCESLRELEVLNRLSGESGRSMSIFLRINPDRLPKKFGVNMAGRPSQFGIDEADVDAVLDRLPEWEHLRFAGFHIYSGTNSLSAEAISENFSIFIELFVRFSEKHRLRPEKLIFGSGFGIPYYAGDEPLDVHRLAELVNPQIDAIRKHPLIGEAEYVLEMGRFLVGPNGYFLTSVIGEKTSRGTEIRLCDGGMNNHLAACGLLGMVIRRNYPIWKVTGNTEPESKYMLVGPLCTTIDTLAEHITLPSLHLGDVIAIGSSGAYGLTSSPVGFISHPAPREALVTGTGDDARVVDVTQ